MSTSGRVVVLSIEFDLERESLVRIGGEEIRGFREDGLAE